MISSLLNLAIFLLGLLVAGLIAPAAAEQPLDGSDGRPLAIDQFEPRPSLVLPEHRPSRAKYPVVDIHTHPARKFRGDAQRLDEFVRLMDEQNIALCVSLDGRWGEKLEEHNEYLLEKHPDRFLVFANVDWVGSGDREKTETWDCQRPDFGHRIAKQLADSKARGAVGLKIYKMLGLFYRNPDGSLMAVDDRRWDPIWQACGELDLPVLIHTADPVAFFQPIDRHNERWEELSRHPDWSFAKSGYPTHEELLAARNRVIERHPNTQFICAHVANYPENLAQVAQWLDKYPNMHTEIAARIAELGRQPYTAREFLIRYQDRVMFGTDGPRTAGRLVPHWRMLETRDEYFTYAEDQYPPQGLWNIYGLDLPDQVLRKLYYENAARLIAGVQERLERYLAVSSAAENTEKEDAVSP